MTTVMPTGHACGFTIFTAVVGSDLIGRIVARALTDISINGYLPSAICMNAHRFTGAPFIPRVIPSIIYTAFSGGI
tara:strand:- start:241 stop:468 length:228 start_codon:yes stop_codon:yes gene_type:complete